MTDVLTPSWADPFVKRANFFGLRTVGEESRVGWDDVGLSKRPPLPPRGRSQVRRGLGEGPFFTLRSILGAWALLISKPDPATARLARANREIPVRIPLLPPQFDLCHQPRYAMPIVLPIRGVA